MKKPCRPQSAVIYLCLIILAFSLAGCTSVRLMADYDPKMDDGVTTLQKKTDAFLVKLERTCRTPEGAYTQNLSFYDDAKVELSALQVRADATPLNNLMSEQIKQLKDSFDKMEAQHKKGFTPMVVAQTRELLNIQFTAILKLEMAKKRDSK